MCPCYMPASTYGSTGSTTVSQASRCRMAVSKNCTSHREGSGVLNSKDSMTRRGLSSSGHDDLAEQSSRTPQRVWCACTTIFQVWPNVSVWKEGDGSGLRSSLARFSITW